MWLFHRLLGIKGILSSSSELGIMLIIPRRFVILLTKVFVCRMGYPFWVYISGIDIYGQFSYIYISNDIAIRIAASLRFAEHWKDRRRCPSLNCAK